MNIVRTRKSVFVIKDIVFIVLARAAVDLSFAFMMLGSVAFEGRAAGVLGEPPSDGP